MNRNPETIDIVLNGESRSLEPGLSIEKLLARLNLDSRTVVVEHNRVIIRGPDLAHTELRAGDNVELVHFVGGG